MPKWLWGIPHQLRSNVWVQLRRTFFCVYHFYRKGFIVYVGNLQVRVKLQYVVEGNTLDLHRVMASVCRQKILLALSKQKVLNIMALVHEVNSTFGEIDRHLRLLDDLVVQRRSGRMRYVRLNWKNEYTPALVEIVKFLAGQGRLFPVQPPQGTGITCPKERMQRADLQVVAAFTSEKQPKPNAENSDTLPTAFVSC